ncbi:MAG: alpha/beta hydrolase [Streptosporangiales bacterium]
MLRMLVVAAVAAVLVAAGLVSTGRPRPAPASDGAAYGPVRVLGDLRTADRVAVLVPGVGIDPAHLGAPNQVLGMARALAAEARHTAPGVRLAVVAWADYPAPDGLGLAVARGGRARVGARRFGAYLDQLETRTRAPIGLFCHSYGSVVCGLSSLDGQVTDLVLYGSPGVRRDRAAAFGHRIRVWAARNDDDWIRFVPNVRFGDLGHGRDPVDPAFGARVFASGGAKGHGDYYERGSESLRNLTRIATGHSNEVSCTRPGCHTGRPNG